MFKVWLLFLMAAFNMPTSRLSLSERQNLEQNLLKTSTAR